MIKNHRTLDEIHSGPMKKEWAFDENDPAMEEKDPAFDEFVSPFAALNGLVAITPAPSPLGR